MHALTGPQWFVVGFLVIFAFCLGGLVEVLHEAASERRRMRDGRCH